MRMHAKGTDPLAPPCAAEPEGHQEKLQLWLQNNEAIPAVRFMQGMQPPTGPRSRPHLPQYKAGHLTPSYPTAVEGWPPGYAYPSRRHWACSSSSSATEWWVAVGAGGRHECSRSHLLRLSI